MLDIHTNNLVESWHNVLKSRYLKGARRQRADMLVHILLDEVLESIRLKVLLALNGFQRRRSNLAEQNQQEKCNSIPSELAMNLVSHMHAQDGSDGLGTILVNSFSSENVKYSISLNEDGLISKCTCEYMSKNSVVYKHMYMAARVLGYSLCFEIRNAPSFEDELLPSTQQLDSSDQDMLADDFRQIVKQVEPVINNYNNLEEEDQALCIDVMDTLRAINATRNRIKRGASSRSERQKR